MTTETLSKRIPIEGISGPEQRITVTMGKAAVEASEGPASESILKTADGGEVIYTGEVEPDATDADYEE